MCVVAEFPLPLVVVALSIAAAAAVVENKIGNGEAATTKQFSTVS